MMAPITKPGTFQWLGYVGMALAVTGVIGTVVQLIKFTPESRPSSIQREEILKLIEDIDSRVAPLVEEQASLKEAIKNLSKVQDQSKAAIELKRIEALMADTQTRESKLEEVILSSPAKALEVPLIRKDVDNIKEKNQADLLAIRQDVDRVYDQNKWFLGLVGTMVIGTLTLAISNFFKKA